MAISVYGPVATGTLFGAGPGAHSIAMPVLMDVPASTDLVGVFLMFCITQGSTLDGTIDANTLTDDATPNPLYSAANHFVDVTGNIFVGHGGPAYTVSGVSGAGGSIRPYIVFNELLNGVHTLTYDVLQTESDAYYHISVFAVVGAGPWQGGCEDAWQIEYPGGLADSVPALGNGTDPNTHQSDHVDLSPWAPAVGFGDLTVGFYMVVSAGHDAGSFVWVDAVNVLDGWINEGTYQVNAGIAWASVDTSGTVFSTGASQTNTVLTDSFINNWVFLRDGLGLAGIPYCVVPAFGNPCFNKVVPV